MSEQLLIFVKNPVLGKVKTRIAKTLGNEKALHIYKILLNYTKEITAGLPFYKCVLYSDFINDHDLWEGSFYSKKLQCEGSLGEKMKDAFQQSFNEGFDKVVIIGSDCAEITPEIISEAFHLLGDKDVVIGPATDGGYYLLGLKSMNELIFEGKPWSTPRLLTETIINIQKQNLSYQLLPTLSDVDEEKDLFASGLFIK